MTGPDGQFVYDGDTRRQIGTGPIHRLFDVHHKEELECNQAVLFDTDYPEVVVDSGRLARAAWKALSLVRPTRGTHGEGTPAVYSSERYEGEPVLRPIKVDTRVLDKSFFPRARDEGVVCYEPCGGLCAGLEMVLRSGVKLKKYLYQDISVESQAVARARCLALMRRYPDLLQPGAIELDKLPSDLHCTTAEHLISAGALEGDQWVMICGFPCQDLSPAGKRAGLAGKHSKLFHEVVRLLSSLQQLQRHRPPGYLLENVSPLAHRQGTSLRDVVFPYIASIIGNPVSFDAVRAGSYAHRLRAYWSNLFQNYQFNQIMSHVERPKDRVVASILRKGWHPRPVNMEEGGREVDLDEKSRAMGYSSSELRMADGLCDEQLAVILGLSMDRRAMELLFAVAEASRRGLPHSEESPQAEESSGLPKPADIDWQASADRHPQQRQALAAEWVDKSSKFTQKVADKIGYRVKKLKSICPAGQKGQEGLGSLRLGGSSSGNKKSKMQHFSVAQYRHRHGSHFVKQERHRWDEATDEIYMITPLGKELRIPKPEDRLALEAVVPPDLRKAPSLNFEEEVVSEKDSRVKDLLRRAALKPRTGMEVATKPAILKLVKIQRDGVVTLEDATKLREKSTVQNIAPCHLQDKDQYDCSAAIPGKHHASLAEVTAESNELQDKLGMKEEQLSADLQEGMQLLPADVGPYRIVKEGEPLRQASPAHKIMGEKKDMFGDLPDHVNWANQDELTEMVAHLMPGRWNEGHRTVLSKKYREQKLKVRRLRSAPLVPALSEEAVEMRGVVKKMKRSQVREASAMAGAWS
ncbi:hypothetical protein CYMTET_20647 [Cymbomonas tetramitiformis]|uniref:Uncharacterized protein n=1 Tax=Cymbomonas tetramitiformis TaxID=36881 RepID=A0AAE0G3M1_9CHLO|nr:hypothetical protein CYMTET_20647 [Cymbomonas tetramitiformis]